MGTKIANVNIKNKAVLAPMAGVADRAYREICVDFGASYVVSEMVSAKGILYENKNTRDLLKISDKERPIAIQLFGDDPIIVAEAAKRVVSEFNPEILDINMGCPAPKIVSNNCGSAMMKNPKLCGKIVTALKNAIDIPVTVKIRKGWDNDSVNAVEVATICQQAGADAITIHGRTRDQMYAPSADWKIIRDVKNAVNIPVIGNGDIDSAQKAKELIDFTGCDLVMVGRASLGAPWIFSQINSYLDTGVIPPEPTLEEKINVMKEHVRLMCKYKGEKMGIMESRKIIAWYIKGIPNAAHIRNEAFSINTIEDFETFITKHF